MGSNTVEEFTMPRSINFRGKSRTSIEAGVGCVCAIICELRIDLRPDFSLPGSRGHEESAVSEGQCGRESSRRRLFDCCNYLAMKVGNRAAILAGDALFIGGRIATFRFCIFWKLRPPKCKEAAAVRQQQQRGIQKWKKQSNDDTKWQLQVDCPTFATCKVVCWLRLGAIGVRTSGLEINSG